MKYFARAFNRFRCVVREALPLHILPIPMAETENFVCNVFRPESYGAVGNGSTDDSAAFRAAILAMANGDVLMLSCNTYYLSQTLHINKNIVLMGPYVDPHYFSQRAVLQFPAGVMGLRVLRGSTIQDVMLDARGSSSDRTAHGIWARRTVRLSNVYVQDFGGHGVALDTGSLNATVNSAVVASNICTATLLSNTGNQAFTADMAVTLHGYTVSTPGAGVFAATVDGAVVTFALTTGNGALTGFTRNLTSVSSDGTTCTATVSSSTDVYVGQYITTSGLSTNSTDTPILSVNYSTNVITFANSGTFSGGSGTMQITRGVLRTIENCNHWEAHTVRVHGCGGHGFYTVGADSGAGTAIALDVVDNGWSGVSEQSFLGNTYIQGHAATNGLAVATTAASVTSGIATVTVASGHGYIVGDPIFSTGLTYNTTADGTTVTGITGTSVSFAVVTSSGGTPPDGAMADGVGVIYKGRSYRKPTTSASNRSKFINCYAEGGQAPARIDNPATVYLVGPGDWEGEGLALQSNTSYMPSLFAHANPTNPTNALDISFGGTANTFATIQSQANDTAAGGSRPYRLQYLTSGIGSNWFIWRYNNNNLIPLGFAGNASTDGTGGAAAAGTTWIREGLYLGNNMTLLADTTRSNTRTYRLITVRDSGSSPATHGALCWNTAAPSGGTGTWEVGTIVWNSAPSSGAPMGWVCTVAGTPGTWVPLANIP